MRDGDLAAKNAALPKALSAAYLEHQIADLESRVNAIGNGDGTEPHMPASPASAWPRSPAKRGMGMGVPSPGVAAFPALGSGPAPGAPGYGYGAIGMPPPHGAGYGPGPIGGPPGLDLGAAPIPRSPIAPSGATPPTLGVPLTSSLPLTPGLPTPAAPAARGSASAGTRDLVEETRAARIDDSSEEDDEAWRVAVVDASALMWAPRAVRSLLQRGGEVVVPIDAIRTLDMLKKGNSAAAVAARAAARFVEHASRHWRPVSADPSLAVQAATNYKRGRGLRLQREDEAKEVQDAGDAPPRWVARVLGCAAYFVGIMRAEEGGVSETAPAVLIAHPPPSAEVGPPPVDERRTQAENAAVTNYADRAEGYTLSLEAGRFELGLEVLRDEDGDDEPPRRGRRAKHTQAGGHGFGHGHGHGHEHGHEHGDRERGTGGRGRGGRGGRGRGRGQLEPEREVRILLRRPEPDESPFPGEAPLMAGPPHGMPPFPPHPPAPPGPSGPPPPPGPPGMNLPPFGFDRGGRGGRSRGGGRGRGRGGGPPDRGGGFTLLQRPGPPLAHHVRDLGAETGEREREHRGERRGERERERADKSVDKERKAVEKTQAKEARGAEREREKAERKLERERAREERRERRGGGGAGGGGGGVGSGGAGPGGPNGGGGEFGWRRAYVTNDDGPTPRIERTVERPRVVLLQRPR